MKFQRKESKPPSESKAPEEKGASARSGALEPRTSVLVKRPMTYEEFRNKPLPFRQFRGRFFGGNS